LRATQPAARPLDGRARMKPKLRIRRCGKFGFDIRERAKPSLQLGDIRPALGKPQIERLVTRLGFGEAAVKRGERLVQPRYKTDEPFARARLDQSAAQKQVQLTSGLIAPS